MPGNIDASCNWETSRNDVFWNEIAPCDHVLQVYEHEDFLLASLSGFVEEGFKAGDSTIIIATQKHLSFFK